ncbi:MAG: type II toxin-antitoxin system prevent-host-death family antitoxin [Opitutales bacterium]|nr:type II toxin-antitoxin system prevent-host-death family antitoxin [Opitutales bacterium]
MNTILSPFTASISELKKNPSSLLVESDGEPVAILNHNRPAAYLIPASTYEKMLDIIEDAELAKIIEDRKEEKNDAIEVSIDDL